MRYPELADPGDLPCDCLRQEIERNTAFSHGFTLRHPVPASASGFFLQADRMPVPGIPVPEVTSPVRCKWPLFFVNQDGILPDTASFVLLSVCGVYAITSLAVNPGTGRSS